MYDVLKNLSVIVPFTADDIAWKNLLQDLKMLPKESEILLVGPHMPEVEILKRATENVVPPVRYVKSPIGRAVQLNAGAKNAKHDFYWFLHADSKVPRSSLYLLAKALAERPDVIHYFNLQFLSDGPRMVCFNAWISNLRSKYFKFPLGDQGFALSRKLFLRIGAFDTSLRSGEDQSFIWEAHRKRISISPVMGAIFTSARRYQLEGWGKTTSVRTLRSLRLASSEAFKYFKCRVVESFN